MENNSMQKYLLEILEEYEKNKDVNVNIDDFITTKLKEKGATNETIDKVKKSFALIDQNNENLKSLIEAKKKGQTRTQWLTESIKKAFSFLKDNDFVKFIETFFDKIKIKFN